MITQMKKLLKSLTLALLACLVFASCADDFAAIEKSQSYTELETFYNQINDWSPEALEAVDGVPFAFVNSDVPLAEYACEHSSSRNTRLALPGGMAQAIDLYANGLGFEDVRALNSWYIDFGKKLRVLITEHQPENKVILINQVAERYNANTNECIITSMGILSNKAYIFANSFGVKSNVGGYKAQSLNDMVGDNSPASFTSKMLKDNQVCKEAK